MTTTSTHARAHPRIGALGAAGLCAHSFIDGLGIGLAFHLSTATGLGYLLAVYAGFFLFMGATDLLPEARQHASGRRVALTVVGFLATAGVAYAASR